MAKKNDPKDKRKKDKEKRESKGKEKTGLYQPSAQLKGKALRKAVKQLVNVQTRPEIKAGRRQYRTLSRMYEDQAGAQEAQANQATRNISGFYKSMAAKEAHNAAYQQALSGRLRSATDAGNAQAMQGIGEGAGAAVGALAGAEANLDNVPISAKEKLAMQVATQASQAGREGAALSAQAAGQGAGLQAFQQQMASAAQMQGGQALQDVAARRQNNLLELQGEFIPGMVEAKSRVADARSQKGALKAQTIMEMIDRERDYGLSKAALGLDKKALQGELSGKTGPAAEGKESRKTIRLQNKNNRRLKQLDARIEAARQAGATADAERLTRLKARLARRYQKGVGKAGGGAKPGSGEFKDAVRTGVADYRSVASEHKEWSPERVLDEIVSSGDYSREMIKSIKKKLGLTKTKTNWKKIHKDPNKDSLGR